MGMASSRRRIGLRPVVATMTTTRIATLPVIECSARAPPQIPSITSGNRTPRIRSRWSNRESRKTNQTERIAVPMNQKITLLP